MKKILLAVSLSILFMFSACDDAKYDTIGDQVYLTQVDRYIYKQVIVEAPSSSLPLTVRNTSQVDRDIPVTLAVDEKVLTEFNKKNGTNYTLLPETEYSIDSLTTIIRAGKTAGSNININVPPLSVALNSTGLTYAIPMSVKSVGGNALPISETSGKFIYIIAPTIIKTTVAKFRKGSILDIAVKDGTDVHLTDFTVEFLVKVDNLGLNRNNQILFNTAGAGDKGLIFTRFADSGAAGFWDTFQAKAAGSEFRGNTHFENNRWYHIAIVNDHSSGTFTLYVNGVLDVRASTKRETSIMGIGSPHRKCYFAGEAPNNQYIRSNIWGSELRVWNVARTETQIKNNMYTIDPTAVKGLVGYWKMDDNSDVITARTVKDYSGNGHEAKVTDASPAPPTGIGHNPNIWVANEDVTIK